MEITKFTKLHDAVQTILSDYASVYEKVKRTEDWKNPFRNIIAVEIPSLLRECAGIFAPYIITGSYGKGR